MLSPRYISNHWAAVADAGTIPSPSLLVYRDRVSENIGRMIALAGGVQRLRPHIKTHKMPELMRLQLAHGIVQFKCATIAEAEMAAGCGAPDLLLAYQPIGPNTQRFVELVRTFPQTRFSVIADAAAPIHALSELLCAQLGKRAAASENNRPVEVLVDLDVGQHRTGVADPARVLELYRLIASLPGLQPGGLHAYDGHIHDTDVAARTSACEAAFAPVAALQDQLTRAGLPVPRIVAGGTPTFPMHARRGGAVECSPGTCVLWDAGYAETMPDLDFLVAAVVLTRVVSKPGANLLCLDLGHKAIASEMPHPRVRFLDLPDAKPVAHNEEHFVIATARAGEFSLGDCLYGVPWHICPTVALHSEAVVIQDGKSVGQWAITARQRRLTI